MVDCKICGQSYCGYAGTQRGIVVNCSYYMPRQKPQTNGDRFRAKSDEKLASFIATYSCPPAAERESCGGDCPECWLRWLKQPVEDGEG